MNSRLLIVWLLLVATGLEAQSKLLLTHVTNAGEHSIVIPMGRLVVYSTRDLPQVGIQGAVNGITDSLITISNRPIPISAFQTFKKKKTAGGNFLAGYCLILGISGLVGSLSSSGDPCPSCVNAGYQTPAIVPILSVGLIGLGIHLITRSASRTLGNEWKLTVAP